MYILTVVFCSIALGWLAVRVLTLWSIPIQNAKKILNITVPHAPVVSINSVSPDSVGLRWESPSLDSYGSQSQKDTRSPNEDSGTAAISHYTVYVNGIEVTRIPGYESSVQLTKLKPNTHYQIDLVAFNNLNFRSKAYTVYVRTNDNCSSDDIDKLLQVDDDSNQVFVCDPKLLYEDNLDEKVKQQLKTVQNNKTRSRSNTMESGLSTATLPKIKPKEITSIEDLKYHLERAQEDLRNTTIQQAREFADFTEQERERKSELRDLNERIRIGDRNRSLTRQEVHTLEASKAQVRARIDSATQKLESRRAEIQKKEQQIAEFDNILLEKEEICNRITKNQYNEFQKYKEDIDELRHKIQSLHHKNVKLDEAIKLQTNTKRKTETLRQKLTPIFSQLMKGTDNEGFLQKDANKALGYLKEEHAEWYAVIDDLVKALAYDSSQFRAKKISLENQIRKYKEAVDRLTQETGALKATRQEHNSQLLKASYLPSTDSSSFTHIGMLNAFAAGGSGRTVNHQPSLSNLSDKVSTNPWSFNGSNGNSNDNSQVQSLVNAIPPNETPLQHDFAAMLPNELLNDDKDNFFTDLGPSATSMNVSDTFYSFDTYQNPFGGVPDTDYMMAKSSSNKTNNTGDYNIISHNLNYTSPLDNNSIALSGHGSNSPSYQANQSPPISSSATHRSIPSTSNIVLGGSSGFSHLSNVLSNNDHHYISSLSSHTPNSDFAGLSQLSSTNETSNVGGKDGKRRLSRTFGFFNKNNDTISANNLSQPSSSSPSATLLTSSLTSSRFFSRNKKHDKEQEDSMPVNFANPMDTLSPIQDFESTTRARSGSFQSHHSNSSIWDNTVNSGSNFQSLLASPAAAPRPSFELTGIAVSSPGGNNITGGNDLSEPISIPSISMPGSESVAEPLPSDLLDNSPSMADTVSTDSQQAIRNSHSRSSVSNLSAQPSGHSGLPSSSASSSHNIQSYHPLQQQNHVQQLEVPASPSTSYFKRVFNSSTSPSKHEKNNSINSLNVSGNESEAGESSFGGASSQLSGRKLFKLTRKNSANSTVSTANSGSNVASMTAIDQEQEAALAGHVNQVTSASGLSATSISGGAGSSSSNASTASSTASKKFKHFFTPKRKHDGNEGNKTDTDEPHEATIEEASEESSGNE